MNRFRISSSLSRRLQDLGLSPGEVLRQAGLPLGLFNQEKILLTTEEFFTLYRGIAEASRRLGLNLAQRTESSATTRSRSLRSRPDRFATPLNA
jgi:hypothetical protein